MGDRLPLLSNSDLSAGIRLYEEACRVDPHAASLDSEFRKKLSEVLRVDGPLSLDSLSPVVDCLLQPSLEALKLLLKLEAQTEHKFAFRIEIMDYFDTSAYARDFCVDLMNSLSGALWSRCDLDAGLYVCYRHIEDESDPERKRKLFWKTESESERKRNIYGLILENLRKFERAGNQFIEDFSESVLKTFYEKLNNRSKVLVAKKRNLDQKITKFKALDSCDPSNVMFVASFGSLLVCSVVATAMAVPAVMTAVADMPGTGNLGGWISLLRMIKCENNELKGKKMRALEFLDEDGRCALDNILVLAEKCRVEAESGLVNAVSDIEADAVNEMDYKGRVFNETVDDLNDHTDNWCKDIMKARI